MPDRLSSQPPGGLAVLSRVEGEELSENYRLCGMGWGVEESERAQPEDFRQRRDGCLPQGLQVDATV